MCYGAALILVVLVSQYPPFRVRVLVYICVLRLCNLGANVLLKLLTLNIR